LTTPITPDSTPDVPLWWTYFGGPAVIGTFLAGIFTVVQTYINKKVKTSPSIQEQTQLLMGGLQSMVELMKEDKEKDAQRINHLQTRIEELETNSISDFEMINKLHEEKNDLNSIIARKDQTIRTLVNKLDELSILVEGVDTGVRPVIVFKEKK